MMSQKILTIVGARPQFIKAAPLSHALRAYSALTEILVHTGQHFDHGMSDIFFEELDLSPPHHTLGIHGGSHGEMTGRMIIALERVMIDERPDAVLIYGDTNSTLAGAIAAAKLYIPIIHVEAGLRSFRDMPEEINRVVSDRVSRWLFCPTETAVKNLADEGIAMGVHLVGDVMYDVALKMKTRARERSTILPRLGLKSGEFQLATLHRAENTDDKEAFAAVIDYISNASSENPVVLPLHPRTRDAAARFGLGFGKIRLIDTVGYLDMTALLDGCTQVLTDSGGLQKEAYFHGKPCVTLRSATEWVETVDAGWNRLWSVSEYATRRSIPDYGDGHAAEKIAAILAQDLGNSKR